MFSGFFWPGLASGNHWQLATVREREENQVTEESLWGLHKLALSLNRCYFSLVTWFPCIFTSSFGWPLTSFIHFCLEVVTALLLLVTNYHNILLVFFDSPHTSVIHLFVIHPPGMILIITECAFGFLLGPWMICSPTYYHGSVLFSQGHNTYTWFSPGLTQTGCLLAQSLCHIQNFVTPQAEALQAPQPLGFPRQEYWRQLPFPSPGYLPDSGVKPASLTLAGRFFTAETTGKPRRLYTRQQLQSHTLGSQVTHSHWSYYLITRSYWNGPQPVLLSIFTTSHP